MLFHFYEATLFASICALEEEVHRSSPQLMQMDIFLPVFC